MRPILLGTLPGVTALAKNSDILYRGFTQVAKWDDVVVMRFVRWEHALLANAPIPGIYRSLDSNWNVPASRSRTRHTHQVSTDTRCYLFPLPIPQVRFWNRRSRAWRDFLSSAAHSRWYH